MLDRTASETLLEVDNLSVSFRTESGMLKAVENISFVIPKGEILSLVGESGSGKSLTSLAIMGLINDPNAILTGSIRYKGQELVGLSRAALRHVRGDEIAMIFQDPMSAMTPVYTIGWQIEEQIRAHMKLTRRQARARAVDLLAEMGMPNPATQVDRYPHQLSGGNAPESHDRHGALLQPFAADRRRADHGPRRDRPGPDPAPDRTAQARPWLVHHLHHSRHGRRG